MKSQRNAKKLGSLQTDQDQVHQQIINGGGATQEGGFANGTAIGKSRSGLITLSPRKVAEMSPERTAEI